MITKSLHAGEEEGKRENERPCSDFYRPRGAGLGATPKRCVVTRIGRSDWPRPPARPGHDVRKSQHSTSGKVAPSRENVSLRPHDMI